MRWCAAAYINDIFVLEIHSKISFSNSQKKHDGTPSESIESRWNRSGSPSRYPYIPTFGGRPGLSFALELPKQLHLRSWSRVQDTTRFSYHMNGHLSKVRLRRDYVTYKRAEYPRHYLFYTFIMIELVFLQP